MNRVLSPFVRLLQPRRLGVVLVAASLVFAFLALNWHSDLQSLAVRVFGPALAALGLFTLFEHWPRRLPRPLARWPLQVAAATLVVPAVELALYLSTITPGQPPFWDVPERMNGFLLLCVMGMLVSSWVAMGALVRQRDALVVQGERTRGELQRQALDARLRLLQAQVEPHFLFNTLANVQALVDAGSPQASPVLASLVAYLRAAVPRLAEPQSRLGQELEMVNAYLALMQLRLPDRLQFSVQVDAGLETLRCPPLMLLTLVENAVRHGIDPSLDGGRIDVRVQRLPNGRCLAQVRDTGLGLQPTSQGLGTGLSTLRERLQLAFGDQAELRLSELQPHGVQADVEFPAQT
ncbi:sensor histidine kinase [Ideonella sp.]|uniref:sensor histidine kinase n=1 Tax=Ideonella sp. TaxID=1929293 RepID=UPI0035AF1D9E